jgi:putative membrane protein
MSRATTRVLAGVSVLGLALLVPISAASAQTEDPVITNTETVNATLTPSGEVSTVLFYDQIAVQGSGEVDYANPVSTVGLRNLDSFGGFTVEDGSIVESTSVDGLFRQRSLSDFEKDLPVTVSVVYTLDGEEISPGDLVGKSGQLDVEYTITNVTCEKQDVTVEGANGPEKTRAEVCDPLAGSLSFTLPSQYTDITSETGFVTAGDGRGGTLMTLSITMISGLTEPEVVAGYSAQVTNAVIPPASMSIVPVVVEANPSASAQLEALQGGSTTGKTLAAGATEIDANVLKLADGAGDLVAGLILLRDGSAQLSEGLVNTAAPGSQQLAEGSAELAAGLNGTAVPGSAQLAAGAEQLASGLNGTAVPGSAALAAGATSLSQGLNSQIAPGAEQVAAGLLLLQQGVENLSATVKGTPEYQTLVGTLDAVIAKIGTPSDTDPAATLLGAVNRIITLSTGGLQQVGTISGQVGQINGDVTAINGQVGTIDGEVDTIDTNLAAASTGANCGAVGEEPYCSNLDAISAAAGAISTSAGEITTSTGEITGSTAAISGAVGALQAQVGAINVIANGLVPQLYNTAGLPTRCADPTTCGASQILQLVKAGIGALVDGIQANLNSPELQQLVAGGQALSAGVDTAAAGAAQVASGATQLAGGLAGAGTGSEQLAAGALQLADGLVTAGDGASQVADGNAQLADGLGDAADGSQQLSEGLATAAESAPALPAGALRLSNEGTSQLVKAGETTATSFGTRVAVLQASAELTADGGLPYGAPEGALKAAAYRYDLKGANASTTDNAGRLLAGVGIAGAAAAGAAVLARRRAGTA